MTTKKDSKQQTKSTDMQHKQGQEQSRQSAADTSAEVTGRNQSAGARGGSNQQRAEAGRHDDKKQDVRRDSAQGTREDKKP